MNSSSNRWLFLLPVALALAVNGGVLLNGFGWDDETIIPGIKSNLSLRKLFLPQATGSQTHPYYRPLVAVSYHMDMGLWGRSPFGFHFSVWLAHALNTALVFLLARALIDLSSKTSDVRRETSHLSPLTSHNFIPLLAGALFAVHPIHAEAVAWIAGRNDVFCTTLLLASALLYLRSQRSRPYLWGGFSMAAFLLALLTKEVAVAMILMFPLMDFLDPARNQSSPDKGQTRGSAPTESGGHKPRPHSPLPTPYSLIFIRFIPPLLVLIAYFLLRTSRLAEPFGGATPGAVASGSAIGRAAAAFGSYLQMLFWPYPHAPFIAAIPSSAAWMLFSIVALAGVSALGLVALLRGNRLLPFSIAWTLLLVAPGVSVAVLQVAATAAAERYTYAPSAGWAIGAGWLIAAAVERFGRAWKPAARIAVVGLIGGWIVLWSFESWARDAAWRTPLVFWEAAVATSPESGFPYRELGKHYAGEHRDKEVEAAYRRAIEVEERLHGPDDPGVAKGLHLLGTHYSQLHQDAKAEPLFRRALAIRKKALPPDSPDTADTLNNLALLYYSAGRYSEAKPLYQEAIAIYDRGGALSPKDLATAMNNLGAVYYSEGNYAEAEPLYRRALEIREKTSGPGSPDAASSLNNLAALEYGLKHYDIAKSLFTRSLEIKEKRFSPDHPELAPVLFNLGAIAFAQGQYEEAERWLGRAAAIRRKALRPGDPKLLDTLTVYARALRKLGRNEEASRIEKGMKGE